MKKMFRSKDRRKLIRAPSTDGPGTDQPTQPITPSTSASSNSKSAAVPAAARATPVAVKATPVAAKVPPNTTATTTNNNNSSKSDPKPTIIQPPPLMARRSTIHRTTASLSAYRATPITKHYSLNNQILTAFESHYENKLFTIAYAIGLQFVETALLEIPKHGYFYSTRHTQERTANSLNAIRVSNMLQTILEQQEKNPSADFGMDLKQEFTKVQKLASLALEQAEESDKNQYEANRAALEAELNEMKKQEAPTTLLGDACGPLIDSFTETMCPPGGIMGATSADGTPGAPGTATAVANNHAAAAKEQAPPNAIPPPPPQERTMSSMMREMMQQPKPSEIPPPPPPPPGVQIAQPVTATVVRPDPPALHPTMSAVSRASVTHATLPPPPPLEGGGWLVMPETMPDRPEFGRQMSGRTYADHVALERALYLSGLEVQPELMGIIDPSLVIPPDDDDQWMLEHALKESEREMEVLREQEELQILKACQQSEEQQYQLPQHLLQPTTVIMPEQAGAAAAGAAAANAPGAPQLQRRFTKSRLQIETLHMLYHEDFVHLWNSGRVRVTHVDTYQGKNPGSTNGCTVIAPLLCIHHFINFTEPDFNGQPRDDPGLPDETIKSVIDEEVPSILPNVREELGVTQDAFLIPSDSHDYLLKNQLLSQDQFVTVIGGNILDERHLSELIRTLVEGSVPVDSTIASKPEGEESGDAEEGSGGGGEKEEGDAAASSSGGSAAGAANGAGGSGAADESETSNGETPSIKPAESNGPYNKPGAAAKANRDLKKAKIACTLFFHEHVVSILKLRRAHDDKAWFDIIDSLPSKQMLSREVGVSTLEDTPEGGPVDEFGIPIGDFETPINTARIRCLDEEALSVALRWYACAKFNSENLNYIDTYPWDDQSTDFDPRVFQAFVWTEAE